MELVCVHLGADLGHRARIMVVDTRVHALVACVTHIKVGRARRADQHNADFGL